MIVPGSILFPGATGNNVSTPDSAVLDIVGDITVAVHVQLASWTPPSDQGIISKYTTAGSQRSWRLSKLVSGRIEWGHSPAGFVLPVKNVDPPAIPFDGWLWLAVAFCVDNGAGGNTATFLTSVDGDTWSAFGVDTDPGTTSIFDSTAPLRIGGDDFGMLEGAVDHARVLAGCGVDGDGHLTGVEVFRFDGLTDLPIGFDPAATSFQASTGQVVTVHRQGSPSTTIVPTTDIGVGQVCTYGAGFYGQGAYGVCDLRNRPGCVPLGRSASPLTRTRPFDPGCPPAEVCR